MLNIGPHLIIQVGYPCMSKYTGPVL